MMFFSSNSADAAFTNACVSFKNVTQSSAKRQLPFVLHARVVSGTGGGPDKTILNSPRYLNKMGYRSACMYLRDPADEGFDVLKQRAIERDASIVEVDDFGVLDWRIVKRARQELLKLRPDIWHGHDYKSNLLGLILRRDHPMKLVTTVHGWVQKTWKTPLYYAIDRRCLPRYDQVICVSSDLFDTCRRLGVREDRSFLIENAIDVEQFRRRQSHVEAKRKLGLPESDLLIGAVGRLSPEKGFDRLIKIVKALHQREIQVRLAIIGDGGQREELQSLIGQLDLSASVKLMGFQNNPTDWYEAMDVFALSSLREGLPNVVLEAMSLGTPVVTTAVAGVPRLIEHDVSGIVVPIADDSALESGLETVLSDSKLRTRLADAARKVVEARYSFADRMNKMVDVYRSLDG